MIKGTMDGGDGGVEGGNGRGHYGCFQMCLLPITCLEIKFSSGWCCNKFHEEKNVNVFIRLWQRRMWGLF